MTRWVLRARRWKGGPSSPVPSRAGAPSGGSAQPEIRGSFSLKYKDDISRGNDDISIGKDDISRGCRGDILQSQPN